MAPHFYAQFTPAGYKIEIVPFESPTDGKNGVVTNSVDFGLFGLAAATIGGGAGEPVVVIARRAIRGMAVVARADGPIATIKDLKGKKVGILPGTTQEVVILDRFKAEGHDDQGRAAGARAVRRDAGGAAAPRRRRLCRRRAGPGHQPGDRRRQDRGVSLLDADPARSTWCSQPRRRSSTPIRRSVRLMLDIHRKASEYGHGASGGDVARWRSRSSARSAHSIDKAIGNVELTWKIDDLFEKEAHYYGAQMLEMKQIRALPDYSKLSSPALRRRAHEGELSGDVPCRLLVFSRHCRACPGNPSIGVTRLRPCTGTRHRGPSGSSPG
ncbi:MAG: ABC transporter substrate-binding protein [Pseudomonadota bacterium]